MSNFLGNLAARSMGLAETIQPRILPLYEPHVRESGLLSARPRPRTADSEARSDGAPADEEGPVAERRLSLPMREPLPPRAWEPARLGERRLRQEPQLREDSQIRDGQSLPTEPVRMEPVRTEPVQTEPPLRESRVPVGTDPVTVNIVVPVVVSDAALSAEFPAAARISTAPDVATQTVQAERTVKPFDVPEPQARQELPAAKRFVTGETPTGEPVRRSVPATKHAEQTPGRREAAPEDPAYVPQAGPPRGATSLAEPAPPAARPNGIRPPAASIDHPRKDAEPDAEPFPVSASPRRALPQPMAVRTEASISPPLPLSGTPSSSISHSGPGVRNGTSAEPSVRITIGRVEVRAVFPEPAVRRTLVPRSKPTVSLDDYLKQSNRGNR
jgi:hypothetical protein